MKILFIFTGGTIGSTAGESYISTDSKKPYVLLESYDKLYGMDFEYAVEEPYTELSENNTGETIRRLVNVVASCQDADLDGIVVTHGTDTIQYSAAALAYSVKPKCPVMIVSANFPIEDPRSNGLINLHAAVSFIKYIKKPGVWVAYRNTGEAAVIHYGTRLLESDAFSDRFYSIKDAYLGSFDDKFKFCFNNITELSDETEAIPCYDLDKAAKRILIIEPHPGMIYPSLEGIDHVIHKSFHSGTINTKSFFPSDFFAKAAEKGTSVFLTGVSSAASAGSGTTYESTKLFDEMSVIPVADIAPIAAYVKLWLCVAAGKDPRQVLGKPLSWDIVP